jgi:hypothetical protein
MKRKYPLEVPVLSAADMTTRYHQQINGQCCLLGHAQNVFLPDYDKPDGHAYEGDFQERGFGRVMSALITAAERGGVMGSGTSVWFLNDERCADDQMRADVWNKAMAILGYTEGNPEVAK